MKTKERNEKVWERCKIAMLIAFMTGVAVASLVTSAGIAMSGAVK